MASHVSLLCLFLFLLLALLAVILACCCWACAGRGFTVSIAICSCILSDIHLGGLGCAGLLAVFLVCGCWFLAVQWLLWWLLLLGLGLLLAEIDDVAPLVCRELHALCLESLA